MRTVSILFATLVAAVVPPNLAEAIEPLTHCSVPMSWGVRCDSIGTNGTPFVRGVNCREMLLDGFPRKYLVYVPTNEAFDATRPMPLVFQFHGSGQSGPEVLDAWKWKEKAEEVGLALVAPTALPAHEREQKNCRTKWNSGGLDQKIFPEVKPRLWARDRTLVQEYPDTAPFPADDVEFVRAMALDVVTHLNIDPRRIYATGFSNGASFTGRLIVEMSEFFAAAHMSGSRFHVHPADVDPYPTRYISLSLTMGQCDTANLDGLGIPRCNSDSRLRGFPMDPDRFMALPGASGFLTGQAGMCGMNPDFYNVVEAPGHTTYEFTTPQTENTDGNVYLATILPGLDHTYPKSQGADQVWGFFQEHAR